MKHIIGLCLLVLTVNVQAGNVAMVIHGGAGTIVKANFTPAEEQAYRDKLAESISLGYAVLKKGGSSLDAVQTAIQNMENSPLFNAGKGAVYTWDEKHELDAAIMDGATLNAGAVAGVMHVKSPIAAARAVMEKSVHVMLSGQGADRFAKIQGLAMVNNRYFDTAKRLNQLRNIKAKLIKQNQAMQVDQPDVDWKFGTVGAVALDSRGNLAAGTSTGGMTAKRWGRIGDSPIIGAGTYADNRSCAISATGHGEFFIRYHVASDICDRVKYQRVSIHKAANDVIHHELKKVGGDGGVIVLDRQGNWDYVFNTTGMFRASIDKTGHLEVHLYGEQPKLKPAGD